MKLNLIESFCQVAVFHLLAKMVSLFPRRTVQAVALGINAIAIVYLVATEGVGWQ